MSLGYFRGSSFTILIHLAGSNFTVEIRVTLSKYRFSFFIQQASQTDRTKSIWNTNNLRLFICPNESVENKESFEFLLNCGNYIGMGQARQLEEVEMEPSGAIECRMQVDCSGNRFRHWEEASILAMDPATTSYVLHQRGGGDNKDHLNESQFRRKVSSPPFLCARENSMCIICRKCKNAVSSC